MQQSYQVSALEDVVIRGITWAFIGVIFGSLFVALNEFLQGQMPPHAGLLLAIVTAAAITSLFYGSMRLTVMVANFTFVAMLVYVWQGADMLSLQPLIFVGGGVGIAVGAAYGLKDKASRVFCAEAKIIAGTVAGLLCGTLAVVMSHFWGKLPVSTIAMIVAPLGVLAYVQMAKWFISRCHRLLPAVVDGTLVGLGVGTITGLVFVIMAGTLDPELIESAFLRDFVQRVGEHWAITVVGCAAVCFPVGALRSLMKVPWYNL